MVHAGLSLVKDAGSDVFEERAPKVAAQPNAARPNEVGDRRHNLCFARRKLVHDAHELEQGGLTGYGRSRDLLPGTTDASSSQFSLSWDPVQQEPCQDPHPPLAMEPVADRCVPLSPLVAMEGERPAG